VWLTQPQPSTFFLHPQYARASFRRVTTQENTTRSRRGFASMDPDKQREIASRGGKAAHAQGRAHEFTAEEALVAGRKGGAAVSADRAHMAEIGRRGGLAKKRNSRTVIEKEPST
jgi:uncharacterized protein